MSTARERARAARARQRVLHFDAAQRGVRRAVRDAIARAREGLRHIPEGALADVARRAVNIASDRLQGLTSHARCYATWRETALFVQAAENGPDALAPRTLAALRASTWAVAAAAWGFCATGKHPTPEAAHYAAEQAMDESSRARTL